MEKVIKLQDVGDKPLLGRQEVYWNENIKPKFQKYRPGFKYDYIPQEKLLQKHEIKAFEYGHWTTQNERLDFLASAIASFSDIKLVTGLRSIGYKTIGIAYGARGLGGRAAAHFEPDTFMINLTRHQGFGAFAHEYGHALDYLFGGYVEPNKEHFALSCGRLSIPKTNQFQKGSLRFLMMELLISIRYHNGKQSESYSNFDPSDYWTRANEIFARTFEQYVHYVLEKKKIKNTFLTAYKYDSNNYLTDADFKRVLPKMQALIKAMKAKANKK